MTDPSDRERLPPPPVEPLPDLSWARLERQLWQTLDAPSAAATPPRRRRLGRWRISLIAAGALAAAAAIAIAWSRDAAAPSQQLVTPSSAVQPSRIATTDAATQVTFGDAELRVAPHSTLLVGGDDRRGVELYLERGTSTFEVAPRAGRAPFVVRAGAVRITVVGTVFTVARDGDEVQVAVARGTVEILANGRLDRVSAGLLWNRDGVRPGTIPDPVPDRRPDPSPSPTPIGDPKAAFEAAAALESADPVAAIAAYRRLATGSGPWAANALYAAARLALDRGDRATASTLARDYLTRFPRGANAPDARALLDLLSP